MKFDVKDLGNGAVEVAVGTTVTIASLHAVRKMPKFAGWVLLGAGILGYVVCSGFENDKNKGVMRVLKTASIASASVGAVSGLNQLAMEGGVPAVAGFKGTINKIVPQLGTGLQGLNGVEDWNQNLLGLLSEDVNNLDDLMASNGSPTLSESLLGVGDLVL